MKSRQDHQNGMQQIKKKRYYGEDAKHRKEKKE